MEVKMAIQKNRKYFCKIRKRLALTHEVGCGIYYTCHVAAHHKAAVILRGDHALLAPQKEKQPTFSPF